MDSHLIIQDKIASAQEMEVFAKEFARRLKPFDIICLVGDLGAGKTTFVKGLTSALSNQAHVTSPTFTYLNHYPGKIDLFHFDLYRIEDGEEFFRAGFDEFFQKRGVVCIEWPEKIQKFLNIPYFEVTINHLGNDLREVKIVEIT